MRAIAFSSLYLLGIAQIVLGIFVGRFRIEAVGSLFWSELGRINDQSKVFSKYIGIFQDQWNILTWMGILTIIFTFVAYKFSRVT